MTHDEFLLFKTQVEGAAQRIGAVATVHWHARSIAVPYGHRTARGLNWRFGHASVLIEGQHFIIEHEHIDTVGDAQIFINSLIPRSPAHAPE